MPPIKPFQLQFLLLLTLYCISPSVFSQHRHCGTVEYQRTLRDQLNLRETDQKFEQWLLQNKQTTRTQKNTRQQTPPYKIPVVVHVINNGENIGSGTNISDAQILSQISVLNKDYKRLNADASNTPAEFLSVAGSMDIEFVLAKRDPEGQATNGIVRVQGTKAEWLMSDNYELKSLSYWPAEDYLNIWVCNITDYLGYAQFPVSGLPGLENSSTNRLTDGVVIWYKAFGSSDDGAFPLDPKYNKGRTATHEIGHFFGLRHIWGDDGGECTGTDYCNDTPNQTGSSSGCPAHPRTTCSEVNMFQNFLDYTDDACMNLFTQDQVDRMSIVIENSDRRKSLLTSLGDELPSPVANDIGIKTILSPTETQCSADVTPSIEVKNYGNNTITSVRVRLKINGVSAQTTDFALNIDPTESSIIDFAPITMDPGTTTISFEIVLTNGVTDGASPSNTKSLTVLVPESITVPFLEDFETGIANWSIQNPDQNLTWTSTTAPKSTPANQGLAMDFYNYEDHVGEVDIFLSPVFDLSSSPAAALSFDVAYARYGSSTEDRLRVMVITNCDDIANGTIVYDKGGATLSTIPNLMTSPFVPAGEDDWRKEFVNINQFIGETHVQLAFIGINDFGNNLYIDNIAVLTEDYEDIGIGKIVSPSLVTCDDASAVKLMVQSLGNVPINNFKVTYQVNNDPVQQTTVSGLNLGLGEEILVTLPEVNLNEGNNIIVVNLVDPNGVADQTPDNNQVTFKVVINKSEDRIPLREKFDTGTTQWIMVNPSDGMNWQYSKSTIEGFDQSISFNASSNEVPGDQAWLVSPVIDFSAAKEASMLFDASYVSIKETLEIMASTDCGNTYQKVIFSLPDITATPTSNWKPKTPDDWTKNILVNLNTLAGEPDVRLAFVITNGHGNNFHLDNIELYTTDFPDPIEIGELFSVYGYALGDPTQNNFKITFNLPERQDVRFSIVDTMGKLLVDHTFPDVLNQTYPLDLEGNLTPGLYIIRLKIGTTYKATKVLVGR